MRKILLFVAVVVVLSLCAVAQDSESVPKVEVFGGYSLLHNSSDTLVAGSGANLNGWEGSVTGNFNRFLGLTADFNGAYNGNLAGTGTDGNVYNFLFGPTVSYRNSSRLTPFAHVLFGESRLNGGVTGNVAESDFAMAVGGGVDAKVSPRFAVRLGQLDWLRTDYYSTPASNVRFSSGVVFRF